MNACAKFQGNPSSSSSDISLSSINANLMVALEDKSQDRVIRIMVREP